MRLGGVGMIVFAVAVAVGWVAGRAVRSASPTVRLIVPHVIDVIRLRAALDAHNARAREEGR